MAINKVIYGNQTLIDLTNDTISAPKLLEGYTAHNAAGQSITGSLFWRIVVQETLLYLDRARVNQQTLNTDGSVTGTTLIL